jgi:hypothetical protein
MALLVLVLGCGDNDSPGPGPVEYMTASINGTPWDGSQNLSASWQNLVLTVSGVNAAQQRVQIALANVQGPGDFLLSPGNVNAGLGNLIEGVAIWASNVEGGSGTLTVSILTANRVKGTFNFIAVPATASASGVVSVTAGSFDIAF